MLFGDEKEAKAIFDKWIEYCWIVSDFLYNLSGIIVFIDKIVLNFSHFLIKVQGLLGFSDFGMNFVDKLNELFLRWFNGVRIESPANSFSHLISSRWIFLFDWFFLGCLRTDYTNFSTDRVV